jgi:SRSO17 transposase
MTRGSPSKGNTRSVWHQYCEQLGKQDNCQVAVEANLGRKPEQASADSGYCSEANLEGMEQRNVDPYVATGRARHATADETKDEAAAIPVNAASAPISTQ